MTRTLVTLIAVALLASDALGAGRPFLRSRSASRQSQSSVQRHAPGINTPPGPNLPAGSERDALDEVNEARRREGLRPFLRDDGLARAALDCVRFRAAHRIHGHVIGGDFAFCRYGSSAASTGAEGMPTNYTLGWRTCCTYENYQYAGAAVVYGTDGSRYMSLFVR